jgi:catechol 2,3-dioxygenase-like lactoylglutathione lyase family enzyme
MKPRITVITLCVDDLERAVSFYRDGVNGNEKCTSYGKIKVYHPPC